MALPFFTVGHSTRSIGEFVELLTASEIGLVVDVRSSRVRGQIRNTIWKRCPNHCRNFRSPMNIWPSSAAFGRARMILPRYQWLLGKSELSQLRGLRDERWLPVWSRQVARARHRPALRRDVCRGGLVAVSSPDHCRLPAYCRRAGLSHTWSGQDCASKIDEGCQATSRRSAELSGRSGETSMRRIWSNT